MDISTEDFRRHFSELSDEELLQTQRQQLVEAAQVCYDQELERRNLTVPVVVNDPEIEHEGEDLVVLTDFPNLAEAEIAQALLEANGIVSYIAHQDTTGLLVSTARAVELAVSSELAERAHAVLLEQTEISDEELAEQAEAAGLDDVEPNQPLEDEN